MQTEVPHIYAIGDVTGGVMLAHVASQEGVVAAAHATGKLSAKMDYRVVPACAFTQPQVASVGLSAEEAEEQYDEVIVKKFPMIALGKAQVEGETGGFVKMIAEAKTGEVLGVHIVSHEASNLLGEASLALKLEATAEELAETIHAHPTMPESLREAAEGVIGLPINWQ
jgi:dihydrolipoamide dehydrogenase